MIFAVDDIDTEKKRMTTVRRLMKENKGGNNKK